MGKWVTLTISFLIIGIVIFAILVANDPYNRAKRDRYHMGNEDGDILIVEFGDYLDPFCATVEESMVRLRSNYSDHIKFIYTHSPGSSNSSRVAALAAECAGSQKKFEKMHAVLYENYLDISEDNIYSYAAQAGLKEEQFRKCMDEGIFEIIIEKDYDISEKMKIDKLPLIFINGKRFEGLNNYSVYQEFVESELANQNS